MARNPMSQLATHDVINQPAELVDFNLYEQDAALVEALNREGAAWAEPRARALGAEAGSAEVQDWAAEANRHVPELRSFDRFGRRIDEVAYHPAYHQLMAMAKRHEVPSIAWTASEPGGHVAHIALEYLMIQAEAGICCPITMTYAGIAALRHQPDVAKDWEPGLLSTDYDGRSIPASEKTGLTMGMAMTEKQGGSDVRANTTRAIAIGPGGPGGEYTLTGHKWFCSAPMSDAFLTLAYSDGGLSCFLVPRWRPDGSRNVFSIQRLKDKLGNRSNASSEIEYAESWARMIGEEGRGVRTIIEMVHHTRLDTVMAAAAFMRQGIAHASHHCAHRQAFQKLLIQQPLMRAVLADLALESEAATILALRIARAFDEAEAGDQAAGAFARIAVAVGKYWLNKRVTNHVLECLECHGGAGYVEEGPMARLFREAPVNGIWEGSGNVICLDVLRALAREPEAAAAFMAELDLAAGADRRLDQAIADLQALLANPEDAERRAREIVERLALVLQAGLMIRHAPPAMADGFIASRFDDHWGRAYGTLPAGLDLEAIVERVRPKL